MLTLLLLTCGLILAQPPAAPAPTSPAATPKANSAIAPAPRTDEGWVKRNDSFNARARQGAAKGDIGIVFLGDSITHGWENHGREAWAAHYAGRGAVNFGIGGDRTQHVLWRVQNGNLAGLAKPAAGSAPKLVIVMIGTNNLASNSAAEIAEGIGAVVRACREKLPGTPVLLLGVFPRGREAGDPARAKIAEVNALASRHADGEHVHMLDIGDRFLSADGSISPEIMPDYLHLSRRGYEVWAGAMEPEVRRILKEAPESSPGPGPISTPGK
ncbi:MAG: GDSL-type esterase/lipase family protein [Phycisphaerales bacterium]